MWKDVFALFNGVRIGNKYYLEANRCAMKSNGIGQVAITIVMTLALIIDIIYYFITN